MLKVSRIFKTAGSEGSLIIKDENKLSLSERLKKEEKEVSRVIKRAGMDYITYGLTAGDVARRGAWGVTQYRPVGMNNIIEIDQPYVTHRAMEKALKSTWEDYVALVTFDMGNETEVDFQDLPAKPKAKVSRVIKKAHGSPYDRGTADSYYRRGRNPHYYVGGSYTTPRVEEADMTPQEIAGYHAGYDDNESDGNFKEW